VRCRSIDRSTATAHVEPGSLIWSNASRRSPPPANGYRRIHVPLRRKGWRVNGQRQDSLLIVPRNGLAMRHKTPKRRVKAKLREDRQSATRPNETWAMGFVHGQLATGRRLQVLRISQKEHAHWSARGNPVSVPAMKLIKKKPVRHGRTVSYDRFNVN
jgi:hypothetical protein